MKRLYQKDICHANAVLDKVCAFNQNTSQGGDTMAKHRKRMKLPNNFGSIKYLGKGRRKPYGVYPPVTEYGLHGPITPKALAYAETWEEGYEILTAYNMEKAGKIKVNRGAFIDRTPTFSEVYERFFHEKYHSSPKKLSEASMRSTEAAYKNCSSMQFGQLKYEDLQEVLNNCPLKHSSLELIISLLHQMYKYALKYEIVDKNYSVFLYLPKEEDDESGIPFTDSDLKTLWENQEDPIVEMILIMCYSGFRIQAYTDMAVDLENRCLIGGVKTKNSKARTVPIHSSIYCLVANRCDGSRNLLLYSAGTFRRKMYAALERLGIEKHTPHDCRHTFSMLCERYGVSENDRKRMLGHSFGNDITNATYGHRTLEELRAEIEKIKAFPICC